MSSLNAVLPAGALRARPHRPVNDPATPDAYVRALAARVPGVEAVGQVDHLQCAALGLSNGYPSTPVAANQLGRDFFGLLPSVEASMPRTYRAVDA